MMAKPIKALELQYPMIQFLIIWIIISELRGTTQQSSSRRGFATMSNSLPFYIPFTLLALVFSFWRLKWQISLRFHMLQPVKYLPFQLAEAWTQAREAPRIGYYGGTPLLRGES